MDAAHLRALEDRGHLVLPTAHTIGLVQDKFIQKQTLQAAGLPVPQMRHVEDANQLTEVVRDLGLPLLLKARRNAYDGKGNATIRALADIEPAWKRLGGDRDNPLFVEEFCNFTAELAVIGNVNSQCAVGFADGRLRERGPAVRIEPKMRVLTHRPGFRIVNLSEVSPSYPCCWPGSCESLKKFCSELFRGLAS